MADSEAGLSEALPTGLLLRLESECLAGRGDRERRSKRDVLFGSGSVWSKRDRFALLRSVSSIFTPACLQYRMAVVWLPRDMRSRRLWLIGFPT